MSHKYDPTNYRSQVVAREVRRQILSFFASVGGQTIKKPAHQALAHHGLLPKTIDSHIRTLMRQGFIVRHEISKTPDAEVPTGEVERFIWDQLPGAKREITATTIRHFDGLTAREFDRSFQVLSWSGKLVRNLYGLTPLGQAIAKRIIAGEPGDPVELMSPGPPDT